MIHAAGICMVEVSPPRNTFGPTLSQPPKTFVKGCSNKGTKPIYWYRYISAAKPGGDMRGVSASQLNDLAHFCPPVILYLEHLVSCYCLFYAKDYILKLSNDVCKRVFSGIARSEIVKLFCGNTPRSVLLPLWHYKRYR